MLTQQEILDSYSQIELSEDEVIEAMIVAKRKKYEAIRLENIKKYEQENKKLREMQWNFDVIKTYMMGRAKKIFNEKFILDEKNESLFDLLCYYFIGDEISFTSNAVKYGVLHPSIKKGILMPGKFGVGKTWMMKLFCRNNRQCFDVLRAKEISQEFLLSKEKDIPDKYLRPFRNNWDERQEHSDVNYPNSEVFNQKILGLCIDDLGSEDVKNNYGNKVNVIGDLIEVRYASGYTGLFLHGTTNMTADELKTFYGGRVASRMREIFNFIELPGDDRRK